MKHQNEMRSPISRGRSSRGAFTEKGGSLMTTIRKPASVNVSAIAGRGRCQQLSTAV